MNAHVFLGVPRPDNPNAIHVRVAVAGKVVDSHGHRLTYNNAHPIPLGHLIRQARERGDWNVARLPHKAVQDIIAQLQKAGDHDEACRIATESLHARIDRAAEAASAATATMHIRVAGLKRCLGNNPEARMAIGMYRATCERERRFAICRVMRGEA